MKIFTHRLQLQKSFLLVIILLTGINVYATNFIVTNNNDTGVGSLHQAIADANADVNAPHLITFNGNLVIALSTVLPTPSKTMTIDGGINTIKIVGTAIATGTNALAATGTTFKNITFDDCLVYFTGGVVTENCKFINGRAGAVKVAGTYSAISCEFYNNVTNSETTSGSGTAIRGVSSNNDIFIDKCIVRDNVSVGAAIYAGGNNAASKLEIKNSLIYNNTNASTASTGASYGGGIASAAETIITNCAIYNNTANRGGGMVLLIGGATKSSSLLMTNSTVSNNNLGQYVSAAYGGGIYIQGFTTNTTAYCTITNSTISGNSTPAIGGTTTTSAGGGIQIGGGANSVWNPAITFTNCTIFGNNVQANAAAAITGGGIDRFRGNVVINYSIVLGNNSASTSAGKDITNTTGWSTSTTGNNMFGGTPSWNGSVTTGNIAVADETDLSTILSPLSDNGGAEALPDGSFVKTHALISGAAAINPVLEPSFVQALDQRGFTRDATPDMGAFEFNATLPIKLSSFLVSPVGKTVRLNWTTSSETNNQKFEIERSIEGNEFIKIGEIKGAGNSTKTENYVFEDNSPMLTANNYYRLKQIDFDGKFSYSVVRNAKFKIKSMTLVNTLVDKVLQVYINNQLLTELTIYNINGQVFYKTAVQNYANIDLSNLVAGIYMIRTNNGEVARFVKK